MNLSAIWNKKAQVNFFPWGECNLWSLKKFTSAYLFQIAQEKLWSDCRIPSHSFTCH